MGVAHTQFDCAVQFTFLQKPPKQVIPFKHCVEDVHALLHCGAGEGVGVGVGLGVLVGIGLGVGVVTVLTKDIEQLPALGVGVVLGFTLLTIVPFILFVITSVPSLAADALVKVLKEITEFVNTAPALTLALTLSASTFDPVAPLAEFSVKIA